MEDEEDGDDEDNQDKDKRGDIYSENSCIDNREYICQLDGHISASSITSSDEESENEYESDNSDDSMLEKDNSEESVTEDETEDESEEILSEENIPVIVGNRPSSYPYPPAHDIRQPTRITVKRSNNLVNALAAPRITLFNVRSAWSKWSNIAEDITMRITDLCFLTEVWQKCEKKKHQRAIESMLELHGIKYISTPRPGARRGGGTAMACNQQNFTITKLNIAIPSPLEACFGILKPTNPVGKITKLLCVSFYSPPKSKFRNKLAEFLVFTIGRLRIEHPGSQVILAGDRNDLHIDLLCTLDPTLRQLVRGYTNKNKDKVLDVIYTDCPNLFQEPTILPPMQVDEGKVGKDSDHAGVQMLPRNNLAREGGAVRERVRVRPFPESGIINFGFRLLEEDWRGLEVDDMSSSDMVDMFVSLNDNMVDSVFPEKEIQVGPGDLPYFTEE